MKVILDSNFLCVPSQFQVDIFEELIRHLNQRVDPVLLSATYQELHLPCRKLRLYSRLPSVLYRLYHQQSGTFDFDGPGHSAVFRSRGLSP